jgi:hypothetical protein
MKEGNCMDNCFSIYFNSIMKIDYCITIGKNVENDIHLRRVIFRKMIVSGRKEMKVILEDGITIRGIL